MLIRNHRNNYIIYMYEINNDQNFSLATPGFNKLF